MVARVDFADPDRRLVIEYDGCGTERRGSSARTEEGRTDSGAAGWNILFVTAADMHDPEALIALIAAALAW